MPDPSAVRDALAETIANRIYELDFDTLELRNWGEESVADPYRVVAEAAVDAVFDSVAARAWVEGEERLYCERHKALTVPGVHDRCQRAEWLPHARLDGCSIVSARVCIDGGGG